MIKEFKIALKNVGKIDPYSIDDYLLYEGYKAIKKALSVSSYFIVEEIIKSGLRGKGGAGFLAGIKEKLVNERDCLLNNCLKYVVCNADEGEPGTFKDKVIMENDPHLLIEGLSIIGYAVGAQKGYIYIRGEYFRAINVVRRALIQAYERGFLGENILNSGYSLDLEVKIGAGSYLCGEELTLLESIEGKRGYPRIKPPYPAQIGLFNMPTLINNVETIVSIPSIINNGSGWYAGIGPEKSPGTKIFSVSGDVNKPGCFEIVMGSKLRDLLYDLAGGIKNGKNFKAALIGGAAGMFLPFSFIDISLDFDSLEQQDFAMGAGAIIVMNEDRSIIEMLVSVLDFFSNESCGKCVPCRVGTKRLALFSHEVLSGKNVESYLELMLREAIVMAKTSLCPLGKSPLMSIESVVKYFKDDIYGQ